MRISVLRSLLMGDMFDERSRHPEGWVPQQPNPEQLLRQMLVVPKHICTAEALPHSMITPPRTSDARKLHNQLIYTRVMDTMLMDHFHQPIDKSQ
ncbi:hypothetical protein A3K78_04050 [Candidatus Bathyarchaeota archaeon RBG_13_52_12]|nr:MAG: hypothetical protein A3K78_04050 [Candidatus Bathyarchaeota archaeon RBG_13_52_12]